MEDLLLQEFKNAMKEKDIIKKNTIQLIRAGILNEEKSKQRKLSNDEIESILVKEKKKRVDLLNQLNGLDRDELINQTNKEIEIIESYLPKQMTDAEITNELHQIIKQLNADKSMFGQVMKIAKEKFGNSADGKTISVILKEMLR